MGIGEDNRFKVKLPWKIDPATLHNNRNQAISRDERLIVQLSKDRDIMEMFDAQIDEMIEGGILREVDPDYPRRYVPCLLL